jgi:hypothetical protein
MSPPPSRVQFLTRPAHTTPATPAPAPGPQALPEGMAALSELYRATAADADAIVCNNANVANEYHQRARQIEDVGADLAAADEALGALRAEIEVCCGCGGGVVCVCWGWWCQEGRWARCARRSRWAAGGCWGWWGWRGLAGVGDGLAMRWRRQAGRWAR